MEKNSFARITGTVLLIGFLGCSSGKIDPSKDASPLSVEKYGKGETAKYCPVSGENLKDTKMEVSEITLSNGKKIRVCCAGCKKTIEKDLARYAQLWYD